MTNDFRCKGSLILGTGCRKCNACSDQLADMGLSSYTTEVDSIAWKAVMEWKESHEAFLIAKRALDERVAYIRDREQRYPSSFGQETTDLEVEVLRIVQEKAEQAIQQLYSHL